MNSIQWAHIVSKGTEICFGSWRERRFGLKGSHCSGWLNDFFFILLVSVSSYKPDQSGDRPFTDIYLWVVKHESAPLSKCWEAGVLSERCLAPCTEVSLQGNICLLRGPAKSSIAALVQKHFRTDPVNREAYGDQYGQPAWISIELGRQPNSSDAHLLGDISGRCKPRSNRGPLFCSLIERPTLLHFSALSCFWAMVFWRPFLFSSFLVGMLIRLACESWRTPFWEQNL